MAIPGLQPSNFTPSLGTYQSTYLFLYRDNDVRYTTMKDCQLVVRYFDLDKDGGLNYQE